MNKLRGEPITIEGAFAAAVSGFASGLLGPLARTPIGAAIVGAIGNVAQYIIEMLLKGKAHCINIADLIFNAITGAIGGLVAGPWNPGVKPPVKLGDNALLNSIREAGAKFSEMVDSIKQNFNIRELTRGFGGDTVGNLPNPFENGGAC